MPHSKAMKTPLRIVLTGAESSGKSSLTRHLGEKFKLPYALEYARVYLEKHGPDYDYNLLKKWLVSIGLTSKRTSRHLL